jgi:hypothetical protein
MNQNIIKTEGTDQSSQSFITTNQVFKLKFEDKTYDFKITEAGRIDGIELTKAFGKTYMDWKRRLATKKFIKEQKIPKKTFETVRTSGVKRGAFLPKALALNIAEWISTDVYNQLKIFYEENKYEDEVFEEEIVVEESKIEEGEAEEKAKKEKVENNFITITAKQNQIFQFKNKN